MTLSINDTQHNTLYAIMLSVVMLSVVMLSAIMLRVDMMNVAVPFLRDDNGPNDSQHNNTNA